MADIFISFYLIFNSFCGYLILKKKKYIILYLPNLYIYYILYILMFENKKRIEKFARLEKCSGKALFLFN